jgi:hypothetical protein
MHRTRNAAYGQPYRGFESLPLRQLPSATVGKTGNPMTNQRQSRFQDGCSRGKKLKIPIAGLAKSGTTALLLKLKRPNVIPSLGFIV